MVLDIDSGCQKRKICKNFGTAIAALIFYFEVVAADSHKNTPNSCRWSIGVQRKPGSLLLARGKLNGYFLQRLRGGHGKQCGCGDSGDVSNRSAPSLSFFS
jgi:hypothetical protein